MWIYRTPRQPPAHVNFNILTYLQQDFQDFEVIIVNDGSTDGTAKTIKYFNDPRVHVIHLNRNHGHSAAGNIGIRAARSSLVSFLDSDDEFLPGKLGFVHNFFLKKPDIDVLIDSFEFIQHDLSGSKLRVHRNPELILSSEIEDAIYRRKLWKETGAISARRDALIKAGLWDESLKRRTDMDFVLRLAQSCRCASSPTVLWRKHSNAKAISSNTETFISALIEIVRRHPLYTSRLQWRSGLALDISFHMMRLLIHAKFSVALHDWNQLRHFFGVRATVYYLVLGSIMVMFRIFRHRYPA